MEYGCSFMQPAVANQQMIYSELGPTVSGKNIMSNFVLGTDDRIEYAELDHRQGQAAESDTAKTTTTCLAISDHEAGIFGELFTICSYGHRRCFDYGIIIILKHFTNYRC